MHRVKSPYLTKGDSLRVQPRHKLSWLKPSNLVLQPLECGANHMTCSLHIGSDQWRQIPWLQEWRLGQEMSFHRLPLSYVANETELVLPSTWLGDPLPAPRGSWASAQWGLWKVYCLISKEEVDIVIISQVKPKIRILTLSCLYIYLGPYLGTSLCSSHYSTWNIPVWSPGTDRLRNTLTSKECN